MWIRDEDKGKLALEIRERIMPYVYKKYGTRKKYLASVSQKLHIKIYQIMITKQHFPNNNVFNLMLSMLGLTKNMIMSTDEQEIMCHGNFMATQSRIKKDVYEKKQIQKKINSESFNLTINEPVEIKAFNQCFLLKKRTLKNVKGKIIRFYVNSALVELNDKRLTKYELEHLNNCVCVSYQNIKKEI